MANTIDNLLNIIDNQVHRQRVAHTLQVYAFVPAKDDLSSYELCRTFEKEILAEFRVVKRGQRALWYAALTELNMTPRGEMHPRARSIMSHTEFEHSDRSVYPKALAEFHKRCRDNHNDVAKARARARRQWNEGRWVWQST